MRFIISLLIFTITLVIALPRPDDQLPPNYLVMLRNDTQIADLNLDNSYLGRIHDYFSFINTFSIYLTDSEASKLKDSPGVLSVEKNGVYTAVSTATATATPTDA